MTKSPAKKSRKHAASLLDLPSPALRREAIAARVHEPKATFSHGKRRREYCRATPEQTARLQALLDRIVATNALDRTTDRLEQERVTLSHLTGPDGVRLGWSPQFLMFACARTSRRIDHLKARAKMLRARVSGARDVA